MKCCGVDDDVCDDPDLEQIQMMVEKGADVSEFVATYYYKLLDAAHPLAAIDTQ